MSTDTVQQTTKEQAVSDSLVSQRNMISQLETYLCRINGEPIPEEGKNATEVTNIFSSLSAMLNQTPAEIDNNTERLTQFLTGLKETL